MYLDFKKELKFADSCVDNNKIVQVLNAIHKVKLYMGKMREKGFEGPEIIQDIYSDIDCAIHDFVNFSGTERIQREYQTLWILTNNIYLYRQIYRKIRQEENQEEGQDWAKEEVSKTTTGSIEKKDYEKGEKQWNDFIVKLNLENLRQKKEIFSSEKYQQFHLVRKRNDKKWTICSRHTIRL